MMTRNQLVWIVAAVGAALGLLVQYCVRATLELENSPATIPLLPGILHLTYVSPYNYYWLEALVTL